MNNKANNYRGEIDLYKLMLACLKKWWLFLLAMVVFGGAAFAGTKMFITPTYQSTVKLYVNNSDLSLGSISISTSDLSASVQLVDVYEVILNTKDTLDLVIEAAGLDYSYSQVKGMLTTSSVNSTQVFQVTVTNTSPEEAQLIASTIAEILPDVIADIIDSADARIVEHAIVPTVRSSPSYTKNTLMGAILGFVLVMALITIQVLTDVLIRDEEDLLAVIGDLPVLAHIPDFNGKVKKSSRYSKNYYYEETGKGGVV